MSSVAISGLSAAERLKFGLCAEGLEVSAAATRYLNGINGDRPLTPADYASTSGLILRLENDVWINAPISLHNPNFVADPPFQLDLDAQGLLVRGCGLESRAWMWLPPAYHGQKNQWGEDYSAFAFTHADRVRISPIGGCALACTFCDLPYEFSYRRKRLERLVDAVERARADPLQPARHVLISGGTPRPEDYGYLTEVYETVLGEFTDLPIDIMMAPMKDLLDVRRLDRLGVHELSINLEVWGDKIGRRVMPKKHAQGRDFYLDFIGKAAEILGEGRVRSMLIAGLEPIEATLEAIEALVQRGAVPVLSPFRPDPITPLRHLRPPTAAFLEDLYLRARDIAARRNVHLGPSCPPCTHNTLTLVEGCGHYRAHGDPQLV